jgi:hypothetical protein
MERSVLFEIGLWGTEKHWQTISEFYRFHLFKKDRNLY